jgi:tetratricopeptide (TPR) repeat protein
VERIALLPFENLSGDASLDWIEAAAPGILRVEMTGALKTVPVQVDSAGDAWTTRATEICYGYFSRVGSKLRLEMVVQDASRVKTVRTFSAEGPLAGGLVPLLDPIARQLDKRVRPLGTHSRDAIEQWGRAMGATDPKIRTAAFEKVVADDAKFGPGYVGWTQTLLAMGDRAGASRAIAKARDKGALLDDVSRAELDLISSNMTGDRRMRHEALVTLSRLTQHDVFAVRALADEEFKARHFAVATDLYRKAAGLDPTDAALLNSFGYAQAFARDLSGAAGTLKEYAKQPGQQANGLDSLGEVHYFLGEFADAEDYFLKAHRANAALLGGGDLLKAAEARLMTGDKNGADGLFHQYTDFRRRSKDPNLALESARWEYRTGRRPQAIAHLESFTGSASGDAAAVADAQLVIWYLQTGDTAKAAAHASRAADRAASLQMRNLAAVCKYLVAPSSLTGMPKPVQAISLLLDKRFADAAPLLKQIYDRTNPSLDGEARALYAWALIESRKVKDAQDLVELYPLPEFSGDPMFASLIFPRFLQLRAAVRDYEGRHEEAEDLRKLYAEFGGK